MAATPSILSRIVERKTQELSEASVPLAVLRERARQHTNRPFRARLESHTPAIIAEIKRASPSRGILSHQFEPEVLARQYEAGGAAAISVLTDRDFFKGHLDHLAAARAASSLPVLRKDFTTAEYHVYEAAAHGADAILLIAAILDRHQLSSFRQLASSLAMDSLVEVHDEAELEIALQSSAEIIGVNNRDLHTFETHLSTSHRLAPQIPAGILRVTESGVFTREHIRELSAYQAFLVGESLMRAADPTAALRALCS